MIRTWHPITIPTRVVAAFKRNDDKTDFVRHAVIAFSINDEDDLTYMSSNGMTYTHSKSQFAFVEIFQNGVWQS